MRGGGGRYPPGSSFRNRTSVCQSDRPLSSSPTIGLDRLHHWHYNQRFPCRYRCPSHQDCRCPLNLDPLPALVGVGESWSPLPAFDMIHKNSKLHPLILVSDCFWPSDFVGLDTHALLSSPLTWLTLAKEESSWCSCSDLPGFRLPSITSTVPECEDKTEDTGTLFSYIRRQNTQEIIYRTAPSLPRQQY